MQCSTVQCSTIEVMLHGTTRYDATRVLQLVMQRVLMHRIKDKEGRYEEDSDSVFKDDQPLEPINPLTL